MMGDGECRSTNTLAFLEPCANLPKAQLFITSEVDNLLYSKQQRLSPRLNEPANGNLLNTRTVTNTNGSVSTTTGTIISYERKAHGLQSKDRSNGCNTRGSCSSNHAIAFVTENNNKNNNGNYVEETLGESEASLWNTRYQCEGQCRTRGSLARRNKQCLHTLRGIDRLKKQGEKQCDYSGGSEYAQNIGVGRDNWTRNELGGDCCYSDCEHTDCNGGDGEGNFSSLGNDNNNTSVQVYNGNAASASTATETTENLPQQQFPLSFSVLEKN